MNNSEKDKRNFFHKIRNKYRLAIFNEKTYEEVWRMRLSRLNVFTILGTSTVVLIILIILLIAYTGLKEYIPGYPDANQPSTPKGLYGSRRALHHAPLPRP